MDNYPAPRRLWACVAGIQPPDRAHGIWDERAERAEQPHWHAYVRADVVADLEAEIADLRAVARLNGGGTG